MPLYIPLTGVGLHPAITYTRASEGWFRQADDANGERWAAAGGNDIARVHSWDGIAAHIGLLIEGARTNSCLRSEAIDTVPPWDNVGSPVVTADAETSPDGTATADTVEDDDAGATERVEQDAMGLNLTDHVMSVFSKRTTGTQTGRLAFFNGASQTTEDLPTTGLWARTINGPRTITNAATADIRLFPAAGGADQLGTYALWGVQVEEGPYETSYIQTAAAAVEREPDSCLLTVARLAGLISGGYGRLRFIWVPGFDQDEEAAIVNLFTIHADAYIGFDGADDRFVVYSGGAEIAQTAVQTFTANSTVFIFDWVWNGTFSQLSVIKDGTAQAGITGTWVPPALGASIALGSSLTPDVHATGTYSNLELGF